MKNYEIFTFSGPQKFVAESLATALKIAIFKKASYLIEHENRGNSLYFWGGAHMVDTKTVRTSFEQDAHIQNLLENHSKEEYVFVYLPYDFGSKEDDKRNLLSAKAYRKIQSLSMKDVVKTLNHDGNIHNYAHGNGSVMLFNQAYSSSLDKTIAKAKEANHGFAAIYFANMQRILLILDAKILNCEQALAVAKDPLTKDFVVYCDSVGYRKLVCSSKEKGNELFPLDYFEGAIFI